MGRGKSRKTIALIAAASPILDETGCPHFGLKTDPERTVLKTRDQGLETGPACRLHEIVHISCKRSEGESGMPR